MATDPKKKLNKIKITEEGIDPNSKKQKQIEELLKQTEPKIPDQYKDIDKKKKR